MFLIIKSVKHLLLIFALFVGLLPGLLAQTSDSTYLEYLKNNKNVPPRIYYNPEVRNTLKTDLISILDGEIPIILEHHLSEEFVVGFGVGLIMPYTIHDVFGHSNSDFLELMGFIPGFKNNSFGKSFQMETKFCSSNDTPFWGDGGSSFYSVFFKAKGYERLGINEIGIGRGYTITFGKISVKSMLYLSGIIQTAYHYNVSNEEIGFNSYDDSFKYQSFLMEQDKNKLKVFRLGFNIQIGYDFQKK